MLAACLSYWMRIKYTAKKKGSSDFSGRGNHPFSFGASIRLVSIAAFALLCPVDQLVRLVNWATFLVQHVNIYHLINWAAIDKWQMTYSQ